MNCIKSHIDRIVIVLLCIVTTGCSTSGHAPEQFSDGVGWMAKKYDVSDARSQRVTQWPCLRVDGALIDQLDDAMKEVQLDKAKTLALSFIDDAHRLSLLVSANELERLDEQAWRELIHTYFNDVELAPTPEVKQLLAQEFEHRTGIQVWFLRKQVESAADTTALRHALKPIRDRIEPSIKHADRSGEKAALALFALPAAMARDAIHADESTCQMDEPFDAAVHYVPALEQSQPVRPGDAEHWNLLAKHAPTFVQEHPSQVHYPRSADAIGLVRMAADATVEIDVTKPTVYGYARTVLIGGQPHVQLTYAIWYPMHPKLKQPIDAEAGKIDGATLRITLDSQHRPAIYETLNNCGCHHRLYPADTLEAAAMKDHGKPLSGKVLSIEREVTGKYDLIIPKVLKLEGPTHLQALIRIRAGTHSVVDVDVTDAHHPNEAVIERRSYALLPYDELERLPTSEGKIMSMFEPNGLVRGAERLEGDLFRPLGMLNAGQPRQRGTQLIHWDQYDFDSPKLLESTLRLPAKF